MSGQYNIYDGLTAARVVSTSNISGTYFNGTSNNGVGATLTIAASSLTVDSVVLVVNDRIVLEAQTNAFQNGIYIVSSIGSTVVLTRSADFQNIEQIRAGQFITVAAGSVSAGSIYTVVEPLPGHFGLDSLTFAVTPGAGTASSKAASNPSLPTVASTTGGTMVGGIAAFADTAGTVTQNSGFFRAQKASGAGGSETVTITDASITTSSVVVASIATSANATTIEKVTPNAGSITVLCSVDPGANSISYIAVGIAQ